MKLQTVEELIAYTTQYPGLKVLDVEEYEGEILDVPELVDLEKLILVNCSSLKTVNWQPRLTLYGSKMAQHIMVINCPKLAQSQKDCDVKFSKEEKRFLSTNVENFAWLLFAAVVVCLVLVAVTYGLGGLISALGSWKAMAILAVALYLLSPWRLLFSIRPL